MYKIKWTGDNLRAVIGFIGGIYKKGFNEWFNGSWDEYEKYVHEHGDVIKIFNADGTLNMTVPKDATLIKDYYGNLSKLLIDC